MLAEDHAIVRSSFVALLRRFSDLEVVGEAADGQGALELLKTLQPDILICDIRMPVTDGVETIRQLQKYSPTTRALVLSAYSDEDYVVALFRAGVSGYLLKTADARRVVKAIHLIHLGETVIDPVIASKLAGLLPRTRHDPGRLEHLSARELEVLTLAADGMNTGAIASKLGISNRTVDEYLGRIVLKLDVPSRAEAVKYFRECARPRIPGNDREGGEV